MALIGSDIIKAKSILENGGLVAIPTETVYGLAANAYDEDAVARIFKAKNRPSFDPLIVHVNEYDRLAEFTSDFPEKARELTRTIWPFDFVTEEKTHYFRLGDFWLGNRSGSYARRTLTHELLSQLAFPFAHLTPTPSGI